MKYNTIIIGGGVAGLMCAYQLEQSNIDYAIVEKNESLGKKLLLTGGSRCNVTNNYDTNSFIDSLNFNHRRFLYSAMNKFGTEDIIEFFNSRSCPLELQEDYKYFPKSNKSKDILDVFIKSLSKYRVFTNFDVENISKNEELFEVKSQNKTIQCTNLVIATGSNSFPHTGSSGDGLKFARNFDVAFKNFSPAETHVYSKQVVDELHTLQGSSLKNANVVIKGTNTKVMGDVLFTHFGLSGPAIMHLSEDIFDLLQIDKVFIQLALTNILKEELDLLFLQSRENHISILKTLEQITTKKIARLLLNQLNIQGKNVNDLNKSIIYKLKEKLLSYELEIDSVQDVNKAYVNKGGILTEELNPKTMEVINNKNLYFIGETVDLHGPIGGFNITIAFTTAFAAAKNIIKNNNQTD